MICGALPTTCWLQRAMRTTAQALALKALNWVLAKDKPRAHWRRYILGAVVSVWGICCLGISYMALLPKTYTSEWSAILPGAGVESRVSLERIGQAQLSASSPFSDKALSPKVNYREIASSRPVLQKAADILGLSIDEFGEPKIKLIDQTSIMEFQIRAGSPEDAQRRALALIDALKQKLDELRNDEIRWRAQAIRDSLSEVESNLKTARQKLLGLQVSSGLASMEQYSQLVASIEALRRDQSTARAQAAERKRNVDALSRELGLSPREAGRLLTLSADPEFRKLRESFATASAQFAENVTRLGPAHPLVLEPQAKMRSVSASMKANAGVDTEVVLRLDSERYLSLVSDLVLRHGEYLGLQSRIQELDKLLAEHEMRRENLGVVAAKLDDLQRDHLVANAVFSSAVARIDTTRSDIYASYPLIQILEAPTLPEKPSSPRLVFAAAGVAVGSLLSILGWTFAWLHQWFAFARLRKRSSTMP